MSRQQTLALEPADTTRLANLCGQFDQHLKQIETRLDVEIFCRGNLFTVKGEPRPVRAASRLLQELYELSGDDILTPELINLHLQDSGIAEMSGEEDDSASASGEITIHTRRGRIRGRGPNQMDFELAREMGLINRFNPIPAYYDHLRTLIDFDAIAENPPA